MKLASILAFLLAISLFAGIADAKGNKGGANKQNLVSGQITAIDGSNITIQPRSKKNASNPPATVIVISTPSTAVTINGATKNVSDLAVGQKVKVALDTDGKTATTVTVQIGKGKHGSKNASATTAPATATATQP